MSKPFRYSSISDFHKCQKYYELSHIVGMPNGMDGLADIVFGTAVHLAIQDLFEGGNGLDVFDVSWSIAGGKGLEYGRYKHEDLGSIGVSLINIFRDEHMGKFRPIHLEQVMQAPLGTHTLRGTVDFVGEYKGVLSVVDWKTSGYPYDNYKIRHNQQMYGYAYLAEHNYKAVPRQIVYGVAIKDIKNPRWQFKVAELNADKLKSVIDEITKVCDDVSTRTVFHKNVGACMGYKKPCVFFETCHGLTQGDAKDGVKETDSSTAVCNSGVKTG